MGIFDFFTMCPLEIFQILIISTNMAGSKYKLHWSKIIFIEEWLANNIGYSAQIASIQNNCQILRVVYRKFNIDYKHPASAHVIFDQMGG